MADAAKAATSTTISTLPRARPRLAASAPASSSPSLSSSSSGVPCGALRYMYRPPRIMPNYGRKFRGPLLPKSSVPRVLLFDNVTQEQMLHVRLKHLHAEQRKIGRLMDMHRRSFFVRRQQKMQQLAETALQVPPEFLRDPSDPVDPHYPEEAQPAINASPQLAPKTVYFLDQLYAKGRAQSRTSEGYSIEVKRPVDSEGEGGEAEGLGQAGEEGRGRREGKGGYRLSRGGEGRRGGVREETKGGFGGVVGRGRGGHGEGEKGSGGEGAIVNRSDGEDLVLEEIHPIPSLQRSVTSTEFAHRSTPPPLTHTNQQGRRIARTAIPLHQGAPYNSNYISNTLPDIHATTSGSGFPPPSSSDGKVVLRIDGDQRGVTRLMRVIRSQRAWAEEEKEEAVGGVGDGRGKRGTGMGKEIERRKDDGAVEDERYRGLERSLVRLQSPNDGYLELSPSFHSPRRCATAH